MRVAASRSQRVRSDFAADAGHASANLLGTSRPAVGLHTLMLALFVLDLAPVAEGSTPADALRNSVELARTVERLGFHRHWVAEHHDMPGIASSSPAVLIAHLADATSTLRVGSGGVMLPNHSALTVAEQFGMLEAMHPGRIDLGIGRAPGTDPLTARALRRGDSSFTEDEFPAQLVELLGFFSGHFPEGHPYRHVTAVPALGYSPALWLLGSSDYSANVVGLLGLPFSFAHHFSSGGTDTAVGGLPRGVPAVGGAGGALRHARRERRVRRDGGSGAMARRVGPVGLRAAAHRPPAGFHHRRKPRHTSTAPSSSTSPGRGRRPTSSGTRSRCAPSWARSPTERGPTS